MENSTSLSGEVDKGETCASIIIVIHLIEVDAILAQAVASAEISHEKLRVANTPYAIDLCGHLKCICPSYLPGFNLAKLYSPTQSPTICLENQKEERETQEVMKFSALWSLLIFSPIISAINVSSIRANLWPTPKHNSSISREKIECFPPGPGMRRLIRKDCDSALNQIFQSPDVMWDQNWSAAKTESGIIETWASGQCTIELVAESRDAEDTFSEYTVAVVADEVIEQCVERGTNLGGKSRVGPKQQFGVVLWNKIDPVQKSIAVS